MTTIAFNKYQGAGNDFIIIDNRNSIFNPDDSDLIKKLCDRRFGIGADGLILINNKPGLILKWSISMLTDLLVQCAATAADVLLILP